MDHHKRPLYWALGIGLLTVGYVMTPVSHTIDQVNVYVQRVPKDETPVYAALQKMDPAPQEIERMQGRNLRIDDSRKGHALFDDVPQGAYRVLVPAKKCAAEITGPGVEYPPEVRGNFVARFSFASTQRWLKPSDVFVFIDLEQCSVALEFRTRSTWKWLF